MGQSYQFLEITRNDSPRESTGLLDMVNNPLLERLGQRPRWCQETQFGIMMTSCRYRQDREALVWTWNLQLSRCLWAHYGLHTGERWRPFSNGLAQIKGCAGLASLASVLLLPRRPGEVPQNCCSLCLLATSVLLVYLLLDENSLSL